MMLLRAVEEFINENNAKAESTLTKSFCFRTGDCRITFSVRTKDRGSQTSFDEERKLNDRAGAIDSDYHVSI